MTETARSCDGCTRCCHIPPIMEPDVRKRASSTCVNCIAGKGCAIYETRYDVCRNFMCAWVTDATVGAHWQPEECQMVLATDRASGSLIVHVDSAHPSAWREAPFIADLRAWAAAPTAAHQRVVVKVGDDHTVIFPNGEKFIGVMRPGQVLLVHRIGTMFWAVYDAELVDQTDPRAAGAVGMKQEISAEAVRLDVARQ